jgi:gliding motility-associated lipoprotein GldD
MKRRPMRDRMIILFIVGLIMLYSCEQPYAPKPRGYFRIDLPEKKYQDFDTSFPYTFQYPVYASITNDPLAPEQQYWININYLSFKATLHVSHKTVDDNLVEYMEDAYKMVTKHIPKADAIYDSVIVDRDREIYGLVYELEGSGAASPYQFFLTDSASNFVRGALYFNTAPNNDSLAPVIDFLKEDIEEMIRSFAWKEID